VVTTHACRSPAHTMNSLI